MLWLHKTSHEIPPDFPNDLLQDIELLHEEKQWLRAVTTPGSLVEHDDEGWIGKVVENRGNPAADGIVLVEHKMPSGIDEGFVAQRWYRALDLSPAMKMVSPFASSNWLTRIAQEEFHEWDWHDTEGDLDLEPFVQNYQTTSDIGEAGYILSDGRMLDFSGKQQGGQPGHRALDHRDVGGGTEGMLEFMRRTGAVRFGYYNDENATIDYFDSLTSQQERVITRVIPRLDYLAVDIRDASGGVQFSQSAEGRREIGRLWALVRGM